MFSFFHAGMHGIFACFYIYMVGLEQFVTWIVHVVRHENAPKAMTVRPRTPLQKARFSSLIRGVPSLGNFGIVTALIFVCGCLQCRVWQWCLVMTASGLPHVFQSDLPEKWHPEMFQISQTCTFHCTSHVDMLWNQGGSM